MSNPRATRLPSDEYYYCFVSVLIVLGSVLIVCYMEMFL